MKLMLLFTLLLLRIFSFRCDLPVPLVQDAAKLNQGCFAAKLCTCSLEQTGIWPPKLFQHTLLTYTDFQLCWKM